MTDISTELEPSSAAEAPEPTARARWWAEAYVGIAVVVSLVYLWSVSVPGMRFEWWALSVLLLLVIAAIWVLAVFVTVWWVASGRRRRPGWHLLTVPLLGVVVVALSWTEVPARLRFELARSEFDTYAQQVLEEAAQVRWSESEQALPGDPDWAPTNPETPDSLGGITVLHAQVVPEGVVIYERHGAFMDNAGYAYLPDGRLPDGDGTFESPDFHPIGGGWYTFTSSW